jgi:hypothetical protein
MMAISDYTKGFSEKLLKLTSNKTREHRIQLDLFVDKVEIYVRPEW